MRLYAADKRMIANVLAKLAMMAEPTSDASGSDQPGKVERAGFPRHDVYKFRPRGVANQIASRG